ncbi:MAG: hypothetical protein KBA95_01725 [Acidobacteria bacterium]|nr:hypothetical protein [Acidobacteriota bacterium]
MTVLIAVRLAVTGFLIAALWLDLWPALVPPLTLTWVVLLLEAQATRNGKQATRDRELQAALDGVSASLLSLTRARADEDKGRSLRALQEAQARLDAAVARMRVRVTSLDHWWVEDEGRAN